MKVYFFGDSICFGQFISPQRIWVSRIATDLAQKFGDHVIVQNPSENGRTTREALEDMPYQVQSHTPDVLYVQYGMNDCNYWVTDAGSPRVSQTAFAENLREIITRGRQAGARIVFLGTNHPTPRLSNFSHVNFSYQDSNVHYNAIIRRVAGETGVILVDNEKHWLDLGLNSPAQLQRLILPDGVHLSAEGHDVYASFVTPIIRNAIQSAIV